MTDKQTYLLVCGHGVLLRYCSFWQGDNPNSSGADGAKGSGPAEDWRSV